MLNPPRTKERTPYIGIGLYINPNPISAKIEATDIGGTFFDFSSVSVYPIVVCYINIVTAP